jgi:hypothetical protein
MALTVLMALWSQENQAVPEEQEQAVMMGAEEQIQALMAQPDLQGQPVWVRVAVQAAQPEPDHHAV